MSDSEPYLLALIPLYLILWSLWLNGSWAYASRQGRSLIPQRFRNENVEVPRLALVLTLAYLLAPYLLQVFSNHKQVEVPEFDASAWIDGVKATLIVSMVILGGLLTVIMLSVRNDIELVKLGFRHDVIQKQIGYGAYGFLLAFAPVYLVMLAASPLQSEETLHPLLRLLQTMGFGKEMFWVIFLPVVMAPLVEELLYRVILQTWLIQHLGKVYGIALAAFFFASAHGFPDSMAIFPLGIFLGIVYQQRRSYIAAVSLHAIFNAYNVIIMYINVTHNIPAPV